MNLERPARTRRPLRAAEFWLGALGLGAAALPAEARAADPEPNAATGQETAPAVDRETM